MRKSPLALLLFSICMMTIALSLPLQVVYLQDVESLFQMLTWLNIFIMALCVATAVAVFKLHKSFHYLLPITIAAVIFNNWWGGGIYYPGPRGPFFCYSIFYLLCDSTAANFC